MGVLIMPGTVFDLSGNYFRVGFGKKNMIQALDRFEQFLKNYKKMIRELSGVGALRPEIIKVRNDI